MTIIYAVYLASVFLAYVLGAATWGPISRSVASLFRPGHVKMSRYFID